MNARWRTVLRVRAVLRLLLDEHVPLGELGRVVHQVSLISDEDLPNEQRVHGASMTGALARDILNALLGDDVELIDRDVPIPNGMQVVVDEVERRRNVRKLAAETSIDGPAAEVADELDELLSFLAGFSGMGPSPRTRRDTPIASAFRTAADTWHGQREKWRDLIEHLRTRRAEMKRRADAGDECAGVLHDELQGVLTFIGQQQPDPRPPGEPRDLLRIHDELRRRRADAAADAKAATGDADVFAANALRDELDELLAFVLPLMGAPLPDVERFEQYLEGEGFYNLMQAYRHANAVVQTEVSAAFETIKTVLREQVRR